MLKILSLPDWKELIEDYDPKQLETPISYLLPFFDNEREKLDKVIHLAVVFGLQPTKRPVPRDGSPDIKTTENLVNFLRNLYIVLSKSK